MPTQANAEHDPQHMQESTTPQHEASTFPGREKTQAKEKKLSDPGTPKRTSS